MAQEKKTLFQNLIELIEKKNDFVFLLFLLFFVNFFNKINVFFF